MFRWHSRLASWSMCLQCTGHSLSSLVVPGQWNRLQLGIAGMQITELILVLSSMPLLGMPYKSLEGWPRCLLRKSQPGRERMSPASLHQRLLSTPQPGIRCRYPAS